MRFEAGALFAGYTVVSRLGRGGMATVYLVREPGIDRLVALKVLPEQLVDDAQFSARFEQEARLIGGLDHPNIIPLYRYGITDDVPWMALRYVAGGDFAARLTARPLPVPEGLAILRGVAAALDYAHRKGVIHRDLKPQNILLTGDGAVYLADFGVAKMLEGVGAANTSAGDVLGSPSYMAPEQAQGLRLGPYTDVYALAVICFQWLTGSLPFDADTPHAILLKHIQEPLPTNALSLLAPNVAAVLQRGLAKEPEQRFQASSALIAELEQALYSVSTLVLPMASSLSLPANTERQRGTAPTPSEPVAGAAAPASGSNARRYGIGLLLLTAGLLFIGYNYQYGALKPPPGRQAQADAKASNQPRKATTPSAPTAPEELPELDIPVDAQAPAVAPRAADQLAAPPPAAVEAAPQHAAVQQAAQQAAEQKSEERRATAKRVADQRVADAQATQLLAAQQAAETRAAQERAAAALEKREADQRVADAQATQLLAAQQAAETRAAQERAAAAAEATQAMLIIKADAACQLTVNGETQGLLPANQTRAMKVGAGEQLIECIEMEGSAAKAQETKIVAAGAQAVVVLSFPSAKAKVEPKRAQR